MRQAIAFRPPDHAVVPAPLPSTYVLDALLHAEETFVRDQVHIRNAEAAHLARRLARQTGKTISGNTGRNLTRVTAIVSSFGASFCVAIAPA
jgi:hypothetical protein